MRNYEDMEGHQMLKDGYVLAVETGSFDNTNHRCFAKTHYELRTNGIEPDPKRECIKPFFSLLRVYGRHWWS